MFVSEGWNLNPPLAQREEKLKEKKEQKEQEEERLEKIQVSAKPVTVISDAYHKPVDIKA